MQNTEVKLALRLPGDVRDRVQRLARLNRRSMNGEIVYQLEQILPSDGSETATGVTFGDISPDAIQEKAVPARTAHINPGIGGAKDDCSRD